MRGFLKGHRSPQDTTPVCIEVDILEESPKSNVFDPLMATYFFQSAKVVSIRDDHGHSYKSAVSPNLEITIFKVNQVVSYSGMPFQKSKERLLADTLNHNGINKVQCPEGRLVAEQRLHNGDFVKDSYKATVFYVPESEDADLTFDFERIVGRKKEAV